MATESSGEEIREGFICPICMKDLRTPTQLSAHFEDFHAEDKDVLRQLRSVFGKAKNKILKKEDTSSSAIARKESNDNFVSRGTPGSGGIDLMLWDAQDIGFSRSHLANFKKTRKETIERCIVETNNILIRLDKLVKSGVYNSESPLPAMIKARKDVEKRAVPWESDKDVKYCRYCSKKFSVIIRRHHCRLCGKVYCGECCDFISIQSANDILSPDPDRNSSFFKDSNNSDDDKNGIRTCFPCLELLQRHCEIRSDQQYYPPVVALYERMKNLISECEYMLPRFLKMAACVNSGEVEYSLDTAMDMRMKLLKTYESIDVISKKIQFLGNSGEKPVHPQTAKLQRSIRSFAANYLQENMFTMPALPTKEQYHELIRLRQEKETRKRQEEKERLIKESLIGKSAPTTQKSSNFRSIKTPQDIKITISKSDDDSTASEDDVNKQGGFFRAGSLRSKFKKKTTKPFSAVSITKSGDRGWGPVQVTMSSSPDPMLQQMEIIKGYIRQAKQDKKYEEIALFEENLKELELEYMRQRQGK